MRALQVMRALVAKRACCRRRAASTRSRIWAELSPKRSLEISRNFTDGTDMQIDAVEQRTRNAAEVILDFPRRGVRFSGHFAVGRARRCLFATGISENDLSPKDPEETHHNWVVAGQRTSAAPRGQGL